MRLLITGGAGYIGSHVALHALDDGYDVTIFDNLSTGRKKNINICNINIVIPTPEFKINIEIISILFGINIFYKD